ncbi:uncharacterized protein TRIADDRAFT_59792 [Trichoplax adhaerens]|uniref:Uncharacterized protein n=1 Tax=Trichoplax adhaerens TaxID=10228 RepID=B3S6G0_TRIAD|nr:hypothetical protein TRIADDRAFT_59792 [Trichoplax adhaerens]EDV21752.1 hypothetical protein TRIADDRAFT_59792 [Trichoplax adhaerens]|eukprot:XP_002115900.1 hypothetical protein TRIADDRAFT_59792 [Trichoplax adhaerens]
MFAYPKLITLSASRSHTATKHLTGKLQSAISHRLFYSWLNYVFNRVDENRIKDVGPDRVAAEWVLRCGGSVKFANKKWLSDYNSLSDGPRASFMLEHIDLNETTITDEGLRHVTFLKYLKSINLCTCHNVTDIGMHHISSLQESLIKLNLNGCSSVTNAGLLSLRELKLLEELDIRNMMSVKDEELVIAELKANLSVCEILSGDVS